MVSLQPSLRNYLFKLQTEFENKPLQTLFDEKFSSKGYKRVSHSNTELMNAFWNTIFLNGVDNSMKSSISFISHNDKDVKMNVNNLRNVNAKEFDLSQGYR